MMLQHAMPCAPHSVAALPSGACCLPAAVPPCVQLPACTIPALVSRAAEVHAAHEAQQDRDATQALHHELKALLDGGASDERLAAYLQPRVTDGPRCDGIQAGPAAAAAAAAPL